MAYLQRPPLLQRQEKKHNSPSKTTNIYGAYEAQNLGTEALLQLGQSRFWSPKADMSKGNKINK